MLRTRARLIAVTVIALAALLGCSPPVATNPPSTSAPRTSVVPVTAAGDFAAGSRLQLANGASLTVPVTWTAKLLSQGAHVAVAPAESGLLGGTMDFLRAPRWGSVAFSVYGPNAGFASDLARLERTYQSSLKTASAKSRFKVTRTDLSFAGGATGVAYVTTYASKPPLIEFEIFVQRADADPMLIAAQFNALPKEFEKSSQVQLPQSLLDYLGFNWQ